MATVGTKNFHYEWLLRSIERLDEREKGGNSTVEMHTGELRHLFRELLSMHQRCDRLEDMLQQFALYAVPPKATIGK